jgi:hypothetical protein
VWLCVWGGGGRVIAITINRCVLGGGAGGISGHIMCVCLLCEVHVHTYISCAYMYICEFHVHMYNFCLREGVKREGRERREIE